MRPEATKQLLDPLRLAVVAQLASAPATAAQLLETMPDTSRPTMYRALKQLHEAGLIEVVETRQKRGALQRTWSLAVDVAELAALQPTPEKLLAAVTSVFSAFVAAPAAAVGSRKQPQEVESWVRASSAQIYLTEQELHRLRADLNDKLAPYRQPRAGTTPLHFTLFVVPAK